MELAARHTTAPPPAGLELVFTVAEEDGLRGAKELDVSSLLAPFGFVLDHATPIGEVIVAAPTYKRLIAEFTGQEAHAGINPEDGHSAIAAAAAAVAGMKLGRLDEETTANVGIIEGGMASNVIPGHCRILGEARSVDGEKAASTIGEMVDACTWAAGEQGCDVDAQVIEMFRGYRLDPKSERVCWISGMTRCALGARAGAGRDRRGQRRERPGGFRLRGRAVRQRDGGEPHAGGVGHRSALVEMLTVCEAAIDEAAKVAVTANGG
jgi:di/tripeptidase